MGITIVRLRSQSPRVDQSLANPPRILVVLGLAICIALFLQRGIIRGLSDAGDFGTPYAQAGAWLRGDNPYEVSEISRAFAAAGADADDFQTVLASFPAYPPSSLPVIAPITLLPWPVARVIWVATLGILVLVCALCSVWLCGRSIRTTHGLLALGLIAALAPVQTGLAKGNVSIATAAVSLIGVVLIQRRAAVAGGALLGLGLALKPQEAIGFAVFAIAIGRWRAVVGAVVVAMLSWSIAALALGTSVPGWTTAWTESLARSMAPGAINDASPANANRDQVITLVRLLTDFTPNMAFAQIVAVLAVLATGLVIVLRTWRSHKTWREESLVWPLSALLVLSLLATYHRFYDASVLALPVAALVGQTAPHPGPRMRLALGVALACFFVPGSAILLVADQSGLIPTIVQQFPLWVSGVRAHEVWALCLLAGLLMIVTWRIPVAPAANRTLAGDAVG